MATAISRMKEKLDDVGLWILAGLGLLYLASVIFGFTFEAGISFP